MPAAIAIPAIMSAVGTGAALYSSKKARDAAKLDPTTLAMQTQALRQQVQRAQMMNPLLERLLGGVQNRLPASYQAGGMQPPTMGGMRSPNMGQALSRMAETLPGPARRRVRGDLA